MKYSGKCIFSLLLILIFLCAPRFLSAQDLSQKISVKIKDKPLGEVIAEIGRLTSIHFSFSSQSIPADKIISLKARNKPLKEVFEELFTRNGIDWTIIENQVVLKPHKGGSPVVTDNTPKKVVFTVSGYLKDRTTGEILIGAYAYVKGTSLGTTTNAYGYYSLTLPEGDYDLVFSFVGYKNISQQLTLKGNMRLSGELEMANTEIKAVEITANDQEQQIKDNQLSQMKLTPRVLNQLPGFAGNVDIIKSLQAVPGIKAYGDGSTLFYVRGGNSDQNLILVDEAPIYNPSHLFGFVSALAPDAIKDVEAYKGDFPASYGGRLSSVIDVRTKDGNMKKIGFGGNIGPYTSDLSFEGPFKKDKSSFFVSGRRSNLNWLNPTRNADRPFTIKFFDVNARINLRVNDNNRLFLSVYGGEDTYSRLTTGAVNTFGISWNNILGTFRWNHVFNNKLFSNTTVYYSRYNYYMYISKEQNNYWNSSISNLTFKSDYSWFPNPQNTFKAGIDISSHASNPGNVHFSDAETQRKVPEIGRYNSMEYDLYLSNDQQLGARFTIKYGIRLPVWQDLGPTTYYYFDSNHHVFDTAGVSKSEAYATFFNPEPRINLKYSLTDKSSLKASYSRTTQYLQVLTNSVSPFTSLEVWVPAGPNIKPQRADQFTLGYFRSLFRSRVNFSAEGFYKYFYDQIDYEDHANMLFNPLLEGELRFGNAYSYGLELMLRKPDGKLTGWLGYTYSRTFKRIEGINNNEAYPAFYDRPHDFCTNISYDTRKRWAFSANWLYVSGGAISTPTGFYYFNGYSIPVYGSKNNDRLPAYHRLDLSVTFRLSKPTRKYQHRLILTLYNAYGRKNPISVNFNKIIDDNGNFVVPANLNGNYELVPTTISVAGIIPSLNYSFKF